MKSFLCFAFFIGSAFANPILRDDASDQYIDSVLENARELILANGLDPADLPGGSVSFHQTIGFIEFKGKADLKDFPASSGMVTLPLSSILSIISLLYLPMLAWA